MSTFRTTGSSSDCISFSQQSWILVAKIPCKIVFFVKMQNTMKNDSLHFDRKAVLVSSTLWQKLTLFWGKWRCERYITFVTYVVVAFFFTFFISVLFELAFVVLRHDQWMRVRNVDSEEGICPFSFENPNGKESIKFSVSAGSLFPPWMDFPKILTKPK